MPRRRESRREEERGGEVWVGIVVVVVAVLFSNLYEGSNGRTWGFSIVQVKASESPVRPPEFYQAFKRF